MKFNMGCGHRKLAGYVNVDASPLCGPDEVFELEHTPWPWPDNCATEVRFIHSLEHMGQDPKVFLAIIGELYRISSNGCEVIIHVPHPRHDNFIGDPTHVRAITSQTLSLFDRELCKRAIAKNAANSPLALVIGVDFEVIATETVLDEPYFGHYKSGHLTVDQIHEMLRTHYNIARELRFRLRVRKSATDAREEDEQGPVGTIS